MYHHSSPPRGWPAYDYTSPPTSPYYQSFYVSSPYANASPRNPTKRHSRKSSYASPRESGWYSSHVHHRESLPQEYYSSRKHDNVSAPLSQKKRKHRASMPDPGFGFGYDYTRPSRMPKRPIIIDVVNDADDEPANMSRVPESDRSQRYYYYYPPTSPPPRSRRTDPYCSSTQAPPPIYEEDVKRSHARRASTSTRSAPPKPKFTAPPPKSHREATEKDAAKAGIPRGYCIKNWDPTETPIMLLGSIFDANSLGKWIYDWTVYYYDGGSTPMAEIAGELWLLLIRLAGKVKRADECLDRVRHAEARGMLEDFLASGDRLWKRFKTLLKHCESYMLEAAECESRRGGPVSMGSNAGCEFVKSIFGRDRYLEDTEKLMTSIRLWDMRFDRNCESILQPSRTSSRRQSTA